MACESETFTVDRYIAGIVPQATLSDETILCVMVDAGAYPGQPVMELSEKQRDLIHAYLYMRLANNPTSSARVTDRDADWEHSEGSERWTQDQLYRFLILARRYLLKWGEDTTTVDGLLPQWGFVGRNMRNRESRKKI